MKKIVAILICVLVFGCFTSCLGLQTGIQTEQTANTDNNETNSTVGDIVDLDGSFGVTVDIPSVLAPSNADGDGVIYQDFGYIEFGEYPQTIAEKDALKQMSKMPDETGYYISAYDNEHYEKVSVSDPYSLYEDEYEFSDESVIADNATYYFKVEPIKWRVFAQLDLVDSTMTIYLISDMILDNVPFLYEDEYAENPTDGVFYHVDNPQIRADNYAYSELRRWLNDDFYDKAFNKEEKEKLVARNVSEVCDVYDENDATEKVFALSAEQAKYVLPLSAQVSDFARCSETWMSVYPDYYGNGRWWLADSGNKSYKASYVSDYTMIPTNSVPNPTAINTSGESLGSTFMGARPAIKLTVDDAFEFLQDEE